MIAVDTLDDARLDDYRFIARPPSCNAAGCSSSKGGACFVGSSIFPLPAALGARHADGTARRLRMSARHSLRACRFMS